MKNLDGNMKGFKIKLYPTVNQIEIIKQYFGASRYVYNWALDMQSDYLSKNGTLYSKIDLNNLFTEFKRNNMWLYEYDSTSLKISIFDATVAFNNYMNKLTRYPIYKNKKSYKQSFGVRSDRLKIFDKYIYCPGIGNICCGNLPDINIVGQGYKSRLNEKSYRRYYDVRISYDGLYYWLSFTMERSETIEFEIIKNRPVTLCNPDVIIGIDLGCKRDSWIVDSCGGRAILPDSSKENMKIAILNRKLDRQRQARLKLGLSGDSNNMKKTKAKINKYYKKKTNKRKSAMYDYISHCILDKHPSKVVIEDISSFEWMITDNSVPGKVRRKINGMVLDAGIYEFQQTLAYKLRAHNIELIKAEYGYKSTQICSSCGSINKIGASRIYKCNNCGLVIDRDYNAALNLSLYGIRS